MEGMFSFVGIIIIVFGVLQIILFFKMWGMTNDVKEMKNMLNLILRKEFQEKHLSTKQNDKPESDIRVEDLVVELKNERQLKVVNITESGEFECIIPGGISPIGLFSRDEIELFNKYWNKKRSKQ